MKRLPRRLPERKLMLCAGVRWLLELPPRIEEQYQTVTQCRIPPKSWNSCLYEHTSSSILNISLMASSSRASRRLAETLLFQKSVPFVCRSCRHQALRQRISLLQQFRSASDNSLPYTEKVRRKLWGTDNPPGLKDPYGGPSFLEKRRMRQEARERGEYLPQAESYEEVDPTQMAEASEKMPEEAQDYVPAETWDGLEHMGHEGHWADVKPRPEDRYQS